MIIVLSGDLSNKYQRRKKGILNIYERSDNSELNKMVLVINALFFHIPINLTAMGVVPGVE